MVRLQNTIRKAQQNKWQGAGWYSAGSLSLFPAQTTIPYSPSQRGEIHKRREGRDPMRATNLIGYTVGNLTVTEDSGERQCGSILWRCRCTCGGEILLTRSRILSGNTTDCGCIPHPRPGAGRKDLRRPDRASPGGERKRKPRRMALPLQMRQHTRSARDKTEERTHPELRLPEVQHLPRP